MPKTSEILDLCTSKIKSFGSIVQCWIDGLWYKFLDVEFMANDDVPVLNRSCYLCHNEILRWREHVYLSCSKIETGTRGGNILGTEDPFLEGVYSILDKQQTSNPFIVHCYSNRINNSTKIIRTYTSSYDGTCIKKKVAFNDEVKLYAVPTEYIPKPKPNKNFTKVSILKGTSNCKTS